MTNPIPTEMELMQKQVTRLAELSSAIALAFAQNDFDTVDKRASEAHAVAYTLACNAYLQHRRNQYE